MNRPVRIGMTGCGTVGAGVLEILQRRGDGFALLAARSRKATRIVVRKPGGTTERQAGSPRDGTPRTRE